ncbi:FAD dependent oxidoreductase [Aspergillus caelatus]|uniref:FAD dependent oxidoreductase n=1 Tax=Aspergillus caelatus TaxID=61420 RepID=A0A5N7AEN3_9EURO|nr:FAD dependent oxidoreductase [Aspergillus caelatus]KAE8368123.1 FAD dependent oxidoreductase [Aspergillus caelatus]
MDQFDVAVVGLGALGSAAAFHSSLKRVKVIGFEQYEFGHVRGASHDTSRIVRTSYGESEYVALAKSAYKDWAQLEAKSGQKMLTQTGGVIFFPEGGAMNASDFANSLTENDLPYELLDAQEVNRRWPQFNIPLSVTTVYTADTGIVHAARSVMAMQNQARVNGAILKENTEVSRVVPSVNGKGAVVETSSGHIYAKKVIIAADAWTNKLLASLGAEIPLSIMQEQVTYYKPADAASFDQSRFPVWIWEDEPCYYGFPTYGEPSIKAARDVANNFMTPEQRTYVHSPKLLNELTEFMASLVPDKGQSLRTVTCQYAVTPSRQFVISPLKNFGDISVALGCGHAFKFAPTIGRILAELAVDGKTDDDISKFGIPEATVSSSKL